MTDDTGNEIRDELIEDLKSAKIAAVSYIYEDEDGNMAEATARFCVHDHDDASNRESLMDHILVDVGLQKLLSDGILGDIGSGGGDASAVMAMSAEEAKEAGILDLLMRGDDSDEDDSGTRIGFQ